MAKLTRVYPDLFDLLGALYGVCLQAGLDEGAGPADAANFIKLASESTLGITDPNVPHQLVVEDTGEFTSGFVVSNDAGSAVSGPAWQSFCPVGRVTIEPAADEWPTLDDAMQAVLDSADSVGCEDCFVVGGEEIAQARRAMVNANGVRS